MAKDTVENKDQVQEGPALDLQKVVDQLTAENKALKAENETFKAENETLKAENEKLKANQSQDTRGSKTKDADGNVLVQWLLSPTGKYLMPHSIGDICALPENQADEAVDTGYAKYHFE